MAETIKEPKTVEKQLIPYKANITKALNKLETLEVLDEASYETASDYLIQIKNHKREVDGKKKKIIDPLNTALREVRGLFKPLEVRIDEAKNNVTKKMLDYRAQVKAELEAKEAELAAKLDTGEIDDEQAIDELAEQAELTTSTYSSKGRTTVRTVKDISVVDSTKIPAQYFVLDIAAVRRDALGNASRGIKPIDIPGVEVVEKEIL